MTATLTTGGILKAYSSAASTGANAPSAVMQQEIVVQILHIKHMTAGSGTASDRYKLVVSDGQHYMTGITSFEAFIWKMGNILGKRCEALKEVGTSSRSAR
jgi:hypothetical protein